MDLNLQHKARTTLPAFLERPDQGVPTNWSGLLRGMAFCQHLLEFRSERERRFASDMVARARYMAVDPTPEQAAWLRAILQHSKDRIRPGSGVARSQLHRIFPVLATMPDTAGRGASPA